MDDLFTAVADFIRERRPEAKMLRGRVAESGLPPVELSDEEARAMGYENRNALRRARLASGEQATNEFEGEIGRYMGPYRRGAIDAEHYTQMYGPAINYQGWYRQPEHVEKTESGPLMDYVREQGVEVRDDMVYVPSISNANPILLAHEFGHRGDWTGRWGPAETRNAISDTIPDATNEKVNKLFDAWRADSPDAWRKAIRSWIKETNDPSDYNTRKGWYDTYWKAHNELSELIQLNRDELLDLEADALEQEALNRREAIEEVVTRGQYSNLADTDRITEVQEELDRLSEIYSPENLAEVRERNRENLSDQAFRRYRQGRSRIGVPSEFSNMFMPSAGP